MPYPKHPKLLGAQLSEMAVRDRASTLVGIPAVLTVVWMHWGHMAEHLIFGGMCFMLAVMAARLLLSWHWWSVQNHAAQWRKALYWRMGVSAVYGLGWGGSMMVLNTDSLDVLTVFKVGTLTAALGIMLNSMSVVLGVYLAFLVPCWLSLMAYIFGANGFLAPQDAMICGVAVTIFGLVLIGSSASMARLTRMFSLRKFELDEALTETRETHARETALSHKLAEQARRDALTGAYNRRYLGEQLEYHIANFVRNRQPFSVVLIDIDHFKTINDTYGHDVGDKVLTVVNLAMSQALREVDILGRWGRDEFLCVLPQTSRAEAIRCAERLRQCLKQADFALGDTVLRVTASFGVATSEKGDGVGNLIKHCDLALYRAKSEGRDRVAAHPWGSDAT